MATVTKQLVEALRAVRVWVDAGGNDHWCSGTGHTVNIRRGECDRKCLPARAIIRETTSD